MITIEATLTALASDLITYSLKVISGMDRVLGEVVCLIKHLNGWLVVGWNELWLLRLLLVLIVHNFCLSMILELLSPRLSLFWGDKVKVGKIFTKPCVWINVMFSFDTL